jgi:hypothetical protein
VDRLPWQTGHQITAVAGDDITICATHLSLAGRSPDAATPAGSGNLWMLRSYAILLDAKQKDQWIV